MILTVALNPSIERRYNIEEFEKEKTFIVEDSQYRAVGDGLNTAKIINAFNVPAKITGFLGGRNGEYIKEKLEVIGINHDFLPIRGETGNSIIIISNQGCETKIIERGPTISREEMLKFYALFRSMIYEADFICISGKLPPSLPHDTYADLILMSKEYGKKVLLEASGEELKQGMETSPFLAKLNKGELEDIIGCNIGSQWELVQAVKYLLEEGIEIVIVTIGGYDSAVFYDGNIYWVRTPIIGTKGLYNPSSLMVGGFVASLHRGYDFESALRIAAACGATDVMGYEASKLTMNNMKKIMKDVVITKSGF